MGQRVLLFLFFSFHFAFASCPKDDVVPNSFLVRLKTGKVLAPSFVSKKISPSATSFRSAKLFAVTNTTKKQLLKNDSVLSVEEDCFIHLNELPNDPLYSKQWHHKNIQSEDAWSLLNSLSDKTETLVAITDTGIDYDHEDLTSVMWTNLTESRGVPGIDDDGNGCVDDIHGCDVTDNDGDPRPGTASGLEHGTHVAGLVAATINNALGVAGLSKNVKLVAVKAFSDFEGTAKLSDLLNAVYYSIHIGAKVINCSWGGTRTPSQAELDAFSYALEKGALPVVAAGNEAQDVANTSPAGIPFVLSVGATNSKDKLSSFSNFGYGVDMLAPGGDSSVGGGLDEKITSTFPTAKGRYGDLRGTSMSAPVVAGVAAALYSINPKLKPEKVIALLRSGGDLLQIKPNNSSTIYVYSRVNYYQSVKLAILSLADPVGTDPEPTSSCGPNNECTQSNPVTVTSATVSSGCGAIRIANHAGASAVYFFLIPLFLVYYIRRTF